MSAHERAGERRKNFPKQSAWLRDRWTDVRTARDSRRAMYAHSPRISRGDKRGADWPRTVPYLGVGPRRSRSDSGNRRRFRVRGAAAVGNDRDSRYRESTPRDGGRRVPLSRAGTPSSPLRGSRARETTATRAATGRYAISLTCSHVRGHFSLAAAPQRRPPSRQRASKTAAFKSYARQRLALTLLLPPPPNPTPTAAVPRDSEFKYPHICTFFKSRLVCLSLAPTWTSVRPE